MTDIKMWSDHETAADLLGFQHLVSAVTSIVLDDELLPATIGVYGDWGSGKSSLLKMVSNELSDKDTVFVLAFNGWLFEGYDDAKTALMETIIDEIAAKRTLGKKAGGLALKLLRRVNWFRVAGTAFKHAAAFAAAGPAGTAALTFLDGQRILEKASEAVDALDEEKVQELLKSETAESLRRGIREFRNDFSRLLEETKIDCLVVIIDDLDRCLPDTIIETLEAIKLFLFVPKTAFILGADERLVESAVRRRFPALPGDKAEVGRDYLEKLVQFPVRVLPLGHAEMTSYIELLFTDAAGISKTNFEKARLQALKSDPTRFEPRHGIDSFRAALGEVPQDLLESLNLAERLAPILVRGLNGNPRQCKRFLNMLMMRLNMAKVRKVELKQRVLAKLMILEYFRPEHFRQLANWQATQDGKPTELEALEIILKNRKATEWDKQAVTEIEKSSISKKAKGHSKQKESAVADSQIDKPSSYEKKLTPDIEVWLEDSQLLEWLDFEPSLVGEDLRPYFYFSREALGMMAVPSQRMSAQAQEVYRRLVHDSQSIRKTALKQAESLSQSDASAIFEALTTKVRAHEDLEGETSPLFPTFEFVAVRKELASQLVLMLESLPDTSMPIWTPPRLKNVCSGTNAERAAEILSENWAKSTTNKKLALAAAKTFKISI